MTQWHYGLEGQQKGPLDEQALRDLIAQGIVTDQTMVWREGMVNWLPKAAVPELRATQNIYASPSAHYPGMVPTAPNSGLAIASMICGIVSIMLCYFNALAAIPAVICGHMALKNIARSERPMAGRGMAIAGLVTGYLGLLIQLAVICCICWMFFVVSTSNTGSPFAPTAPMKSPAPSSSPAP